MKHILLAWWRLSRIAFLSPGVLPLFLGFVLAWRRGYQGTAGLYLLSTFTVILILWMTYYLGEWNDLEGDKLNETSNRFSGGSRVLTEGALSPRISLFLGYACLAGAFITGFYLHLRYKTGPWTLLFGGMGVFFGFSYSSKPFRWSRRGLGEILVAFCYGWLPIATGFYLFTGFISHEVFLLSLPVGLSVFNLILLNEFPDEEADRRVKKKNLVVRLGKERSAEIYMGLSIVAGLSFVRVILAFNARPYWFLLLCGLPLFLVVRNLFRVWREEYRHLETLEALCRDTFFVNLSITMALTIQQTLMLSLEGR